MRTSTLWTGVLTAYLLAAHMIKYVLYAKNIFVEPWGTMMVDGWFVLCAAYLWRYFQQAIAAKYELVRPLLTGLGTIFGCWLVVNVISLCAQLYLIKIHPPIDGWSGVLAEHAGLYVYAGYAFNFKIQPWLQLVGRHNSVLQEWMYVVIIAIVALLLTRRKLRTIK